MTKYYSQNMTRDYFDLSRKSEKGHEHLAVYVTITKKMITTFK